jgi:serine/threonine-protein kinase RsbW
MTLNATDTTRERLALRSSLSDLARVSPWIEHLAAHYAIPDNTQFAMNLCLEEVLSNVIRHGYAGEPGRPMLVQFASSPRDGYFTFVVEDEAPLFNPLSVPEPPVPRSIDEARVGGNGLRLLRHFADTLEYRSTPTGNRLTMRFHVADSGTATD